MEEINFLFEPGEVVRLKGGGPLMTVARQNVGRRVLECQWFACDDCLHEGGFNPESLISVEDIADEDTSDD
jgi:uncharacterized protein YodC (DUF2158 family)